MWVIPREDLGIPREDLGIPREDLGILYKVCVYGGGGGSFNNGSLHQHCYLVTWIQMLKR